MLNLSEFLIHHLNTELGSDVDENKNKIGFTIRYVSSETQHVEVKVD